MQCNRYIYIQFFNLIQQNRKHLLATQQMLKLFRWSNLINIFVCQVLAMRIVHPLQIFSTKKKHSFIDILVSFSIKKMILCDRVQYFKKYLIIVISYRLTLFNWTEYGNFSKTYRYRHFVLYVKLSVAQALFLFLVLHIKINLVVKQECKQVCFNLVPNPHASSSLYNISFRASLLQ